MRAGLLIAIFLAAACGAPKPDPFAPQPDSSSGLTNVSDDLDALLEHGALDGACDRWQAGAPQDEGARRSELLCGKAMFFGETFGTGGLPADLTRFFARNFPDDLGLGFDKLGMVRDPRRPADDPLPLGLAEGAPLAPGVPSLAYTCAACHFGRLPDGRYAVGQANLAFDYGRQVLAIALTPQVAFGLAKPTDHDATALAKVQPLVDQIKASPALQNALLAAVTPLASLGSSAMPAFTPEIEREYATWATGTLDFLITPLPIDDHVHTISKIIALWGIPAPDEQARFGQPNAMLSWTGVARTLERFVNGFVAVGGGDRSAWTDARVQPLVEYIRSLRPPANPTPPDQALAARGRALFSRAGCTNCHAGPRGSGTRLYDFADIGTDDALQRWLDPDLSGNACCGVTLPPGEGLTHMLKSPRIQGAWAWTRFLHNGSVPSLEALLCVDGPRGSVTEPAYGDGGHTYGCELSRDDKLALVAFLRSL